MLTSSLSYIPSSVYSVHFQISPLCCRVTLDIVAVYILFPGHEKVTPGIIPSVLQLGVGLPDCTRILVFPLDHAICVTSSLLTVQVSVKGSPSVPTGVTGVKIG